MDNDKAFAIYAVVLLAAATSAIATSLAVGFASIPAPLTFFEHVCLGLLIRLAYKSMGGLEWADWSITPDRARPAAPAPEAASHPGFTADATS